MSKSLEFVKERIASGQCNGMENNKNERRRGSCTQEGIPYSKELNGISRK